MPIYMDRHIVPGIEAKHAAEAHREDLKIQDEYGCRCMTYWVDEDRGYAFCLIDAPNIQAVHDMHRQAHGLIPHEIIQVNRYVIEAFMGRMEDPVGWNDPDDPTLRVFNDPAFRAILVSQITDPVLIHHKWGSHKGQELLTLYKDIIRDQLVKYEGREVELGGFGIIASFVSVSQAVSCAQSIQKSLHVAADMLGFRIAINAGLPVDNNKELFGDTIKLAHLLCAISKVNQIMLTPIVHELHKSDLRNDVGSDAVRTINVNDEAFIELLYSILEANWSDPTFGVPDFCREMSMSKSKLYRLGIAIVGQSPNSILKNYRLRQALKILRTGKNISQTSFESGFSSASYFSKCFQDKFQLKPHTFQKLSLSF